MEKKSWIVSAIVFETLKKDFSIKYSDIYERIGCVEQTGTNWRKGLTEPTSSTIEEICKKLPGILKEEEDKRRFLMILKKQFREAGSKVSVSLDRCESVEEILNYLYKSFKQELGDDKLYSLINDPCSNSLLKKVILKKFKEGQVGTPNFRVQEFGENEELELRNKKRMWELNREHCFLIKIWDNEKRYSYKVLVNYNFNEKDHHDAGEYDEARHAAKEYGVNMILLFSNAKMYDKEIRSLIESNIYVEQIDIRDIIDRTVSRNYILELNEMDLEKVSLANKYADIVLERFDKYLTIIFKEILFGSRKVLAAKQQESYIFWEAKFATRHHINFQTKRINELLDDKDKTRGRSGVAIGYLSFPTMLKLEKYFDKIYLLDSSYQVLEAYEHYLAQYNQDVLRKITFIKFTSAVFEYVTDKYKLSASIDFVLMGTGSASLIKKLQGYYMICNTWLKNNGILYASYFNSEFIYEYVDKITVEQNFEYIPTLVEKRATAILFNNTDKYNLYCDACTYNEILNIVEKYFRVEKMYSYPLASVLEGTHKNSLQNLLKELDKEYSSKGILSKTCYNCRGYYLDVVLKKESGVGTVICTSDCNAIESVIFDNKEEYREHYLKTLLLAERYPSRKETSKNKKLSEVYVILLPTRKTLPETSNKEIFLGDKRLRLLSIAEINRLGIEYRNISPFLKCNNGQVKLIKFFDKGIEEKNDRYFYVGDGSNNGGLKIGKKDLCETLHRQGYRAISIGEC